MRKQALEYELERLDATDKANGFPRETVLAVVSAKKDQLLTADEADKKSICQEYVDSVIVTYNPETESHHIDLTVRLLTGVESGT